MIPEYIITPALGALIGYFTNWLAIKMLFKPYTEKRIFNIRIPFTPGLIPKERYVLAKKTGEVISNHLLTDEVIADALISDDIHDNIKSFLDKIFENAKVEKKSISEVLNDEFQFHNIDIVNKKIADFILKLSKSEQIHNKIVDFSILEIEKLLKKQAKDLPLDNLRFYFENLFSEYGYAYLQSEEFQNLIYDSIDRLHNYLKDNTNTMFYSMSEQSKEKLKLEVIDKVPTLSKMALAFIQMPDVEQKIKSIIENLINENVSKFLTMFVSTPKIADNMFESFTQYLSNEENYIKTSEIIISYINKLAEMKINEISEKIPEDYRQYPISEIIVKTIRKWLSEENISEFLKSINKNIFKLDNKNLYEIIIGIEPQAIDKLKIFLNEKLALLVNSDKFYEFIYKTVSSQSDKFLNTSIQDIALKVDAENVEIIKSYVIKVYDFLVNKTMLNILKAIDISKIVENRINDFKIEEGEEIVMQVVKKELQAITIIGGVLGFVIGLMPIFI